MLTRRTLLGGAAAAAVTAGAVLRGLLPVDLAEAAPRRARVWRLSPRYPCRRLHEGESQGRRRWGCLACNACRSHAANHYFKTLRAARRHRAHPHCHCVAYAVVVLRRRKWRMFGFPNCPNQRRTTFDRRVDTLYRPCRRG